MFTCSFEALPEESLELDEVLSLETTENLDVLHWQLERRSCSGLIT